MDDRPLPKPAPSQRLATDVFRQARDPLGPFLSPEGVAVIGATETAGSVGRTILKNLVTNPFGGTVYPVNPKRPSVLGIRAYPRIADVPARVDLAVVVTPAAAVPGVIAECVDAGVPAAIVISAGFSELGPKGRELEAQILAQARRGRMRIIGPNCLGVMSPISGLNATFAAAMAQPGGVALLSQSGAMLTAILDWSLEERVGFSACISAGAMLDVGWGDLIDHFGNDRHTRAILVYMESIGDARAFLSAAREVSLTKPVIVIKAGRTQEAALAAASHTGALAGSDEVLEAAFRRSGVLRVDRIGELFSMAEVLGRQPRPRGRRLAVVTNAGGPGVLATDALIRGGGELSPLEDETRRRLDEVLPAAWSHGNPVDILGDAPPERYGKALEIVAADPNSDGLLVVLTPQDMTDPTLTAERLKAFGTIEGKPVLASWMGGTTVHAGIDVLNRAGIPTFAYPDAAASAFCYMWRYADNLRAIYETPALGGDGAAAPDAGVDPRRAAQVIDEARAAGRTLLDERESKEVLAAYGVPTVETRSVASEADAVAAARALGFPVVLKLLSRTITHKTDVGGVRLGLGDEAAVAAAYRGIEAEVGKRVGPEHFQGVTVQPMIDRAAGRELIVGSTLDPQFGPVILFGAGGELVEVFRDRAIGLPPLNTTLARRLMERTQIFGALQGVRGKAPVDLPALERLLVRFSRLVVEQRAIREIDINPLLARPGGPIALDARVILHPAATRDAEIPRPAIRPYPTQYVGSFTMADGTAVTIRPIRPEDEPLVVAFHGRLSERTVRQRYLAPLRLDERTKHERMVRVCFADYDRDLPLVVERRDAGASSIIAIGRLGRTPGRQEAEFALLVADEWQGKGLGLELLRRLVDIGRAEGVLRITGDILTENEPMQALCEKLGFRIERDPGRDVVTAVLDLGA